MYMMKDPYRVLGVDAGATDSEVKKVYRKLVRQYGPDKDGNKPSSPEFEEKLDQINTAHKQIALQRGWPEGIEDDVYAEAVVCVKARARISHGELEEALQLLLSIDGKSAEWFFLKASVVNRQGDHERALALLKTACESDPKNTEYAGALRELRKSNLVQEKMTPTLIIKRYWLSLVIYLFVFYSLPSLFALSGLAGDQLQFALILSNWLVNPLVCLILSTIITWRHGFYWFTLALGPIEFFPFILLIDPLTFLLFFALYALSSGLGCLTAHLARKFLDSKNQGIRL